MAGSEHLSKFVQTNDLERLRRGREVLETAMACDACGDHNTGERIEVKARSKPHQITLTYFLCPPCTEGI